MKIQFVATIAATTLLGTASHAEQVVDDSVLDKYWGQTWLRDNIPLIDIPDKTIEEIYYYRWSVLHRHLHYTYPGTGYVITEFQNPIGYASLYQTIIAAAGHQLQECRWLRDPQYAEDYTKFWLRGGGNALQYTNWVHHAALENAKVSGDIDGLVDQLDGMINLYNEWWSVYDTDAGLFYYLTSNDAQELSLPGYVYGSEDDTFDGPMTYRPSHNAYMVANARAIATIAHAANNETISKNFTQIADKLEKQIYKHLWDPKQQFFIDVIRPENPNLDPVPGREQVGTYPFRFGIGLDEKYTQPTVDQLFDEDGLWSPFGTTTLEQRNQFYSEYKEGDPVLCIWNGQVWPFSEAHTLHSMAEIFRSNTSDLTAEQYHEKLHTYAMSQYNRDEPFVGESHYPNLNMWSVNVANRSENYMHSQYTDLVLSGLLGLKPSLDDKLEIDPIVPGDWDHWAIDKLPYHGHELTIVYDKDGSHYKSGKGLTVLSDGEKVHSGDSPHATVSIKQKKVDRADKVNIACNPIPGLGYPIVNTSDDNSYASMINDGYVWYDSVPLNRWHTNVTHDEGYARITFARARKFSSVSVAFYRDVDRPGRVDCPASVEILTETGSVKKISDYKCKPNDFDTIEFDNEVESKFVEVKFDTKKHKQVGIVEIEVWVDRESGPNYHAIDGSFTGELADNAVKLTNSTYYVEMGGISQAKKVELVYSSETEQTVELSVNQYNARNVTLEATQEYQHYELPFSLSTGMNYVKVSGGDSASPLYISGVVTSD